MFGFRRDRRRTGPPRRIPAGRPADQVSACPMAGPRSRRQPGTGIRSPPPLRAGFRTGDSRHVARRGHRFRPDSPTRHPRRPARVTTTFRGADHQMLHLPAAGRAEPGEARETKGPTRKHTRQCRFVISTGAFPAFDQPVSGGCGLERQSHYGFSWGSIGIRPVCRIGIRCRQVGASRTREHLSASGHSLRRAHAHAHRPTTPTGPNGLINRQYVSVTAIAGLPRLALPCRYGLTLWMSKSPSPPYPRSAQSLVRPPWSLPPLVSGSVSGR